MPAEHGGWGLSAEPGLLGLLVAPSWAGLAVALAAVVAFLVRTPLKLAVVDRRRGRVLARTRLAARIAGAELAVLAALAAAAVALAGPGWLVPIVLAVPLVAVELWFDVRSRGRRLVPELAGSVGICSVAAAVAIAGGTDSRLAVALWLVLAARSVATVTFARTQVLRFRRTLAPAAASPSVTGGAPLPGAAPTSLPGAAPRAAGVDAAVPATAVPTMAVPTSASDVAQAVGVAIAVAATVVAPAVVAGTVSIAAVAALDVVLVRRPPVRPKVLGFTQLGIGLGLVAVTALSVALLG